MRVLLAAAVCVMTSISMGVFPPLILEQNIDVNSLELLASLLLWNYEELVGQDFASLFVVITKRP